MKTKIYKVFKMLYDFLQSLLSHVSSSHGFKVSVDQNIKIDLDDSSSKSSSECKADVEQAEDSQKETSND